MIMNNDVKFALAYRRNIRRCLKNDSFLSPKQMRDQIKLMQEKQPNNRGDDV